jgi:catechol 2,3-dioxygenase-like lactoylglutathione lyase family enzyme
MAFAHLTLPTRDVEATAAFLERTFGFRQGEIPGNSPVATRWLDMGDGHQIHVVHVHGFEPSPFEGEFGRHIAFFQPASEFESVRARLAAAGAEIMEPLRSSSINRFFAREPVNGYVFEIIARD